MNEKILIIEDRADTMNLLKFALEKQNYAVISAENGKRGLNALEKYPIDLVILDIMLPDISGKEILKKIRADKKYSRVKVIVLTAAKISEKEQKEFFNIGAQGFLFKPVQIEVMRNEIRKILEKR